VRVLMVSVNLDRVALLEVGFYHQRDLGTDRIAFQTRASASP
jgi:hypothetical protein